MKKHGLKIEENRLRRLLENLQRINVEMSDELLELFVLDNLTIGESYFFRDRETLQKLKEIMRKKSEWSILSIGCSKGEEAYTIAIVSKELGVKSKIMGIDINPQRIEEAKLGCYRFWSLRFLYEEEISKYFVKNGESYCIKDEFKENVYFQQRNINNCSDLKIDKFDIIFIRRVLLYTENVEEVLSKTYELLNDDGFIILGAGEYFPEVYDYFEPVYDDISCILRKFNKKDIQKYTTQPSFIKNDKRCERDLTSHRSKEQLEDQVKVHNKKQFQFVVQKTSEEEMKVVESLLENKQYLEAYEKVKKLCTKYATEYLVWKYRSLLEFELSMKSEAKESIKKAIFLNPYDDEIWEIKYSIERF